MKMLKAWLPVMAYGVVIYLFSALLKPGHIAHPWDWTLHLLEFSPLGFFLVRAVLLSGNLSRRRAILIAGAAGLLLGLLDEFHQSFVSGRDATLMDALVDGLGSLAGAGLYLSLGQLLFRKKTLYQTAPSGCETCPIAK